MEQQGGCVVIVGCGLVGTLMAHFMAKQGFRVDIYEKRSDFRRNMQMEGKSINLSLSHRGRLALRELDLEAHILKAGVPMVGRLIHQINGKTKRILYDSAKNQRIFSISRNFLNLELIRLLEANEQVRIHFDCKLLDVQEFEKPQILLLNTMTGEEFSIRCDFLIGADGAHSRVRQALLKNSLFNCSVAYIEHGYIEMSIGAEKGGNLLKEHLHVWPRSDFMLIALPNQNGTWTVTLFMPLTMFHQVSTPSECTQFFVRHFPDFLALKTPQNLIEEFFAKAPTSLMTLKCSPFHYGDALLVGDAAHAMLPFYGQGMNAGFEDCLKFAQILTKKRNLRAALTQFSSSRVRDAHSMCDLAMYNYVEMRHLVTTSSYHLRKALDDLLYKICPNLWVPLYNSVTFTDLPYAECVANRRWQNHILISGFVLCGAILLIAFIAIFI